MDARRHATRIPDGRRGQNRSVLDMPATRFEELVSEALDTVPTELAP